jgi:hypothetical protein
MADDSEEVVVLIPASVIYMSFQVWNKDEQYARKRPYACPICLEDAPSEGLVAVIDCYDASICADCIGNVLAGARRSRKISRCPCCRTVINEVNIRPSHTPVQWRTRAQLDGQENAHVRADWADGRRDASDARMDLITAIQTEHSLVERRIVLAGPQIHTRINRLQELQSHFDGETTRSNTFFLGRDYNPETLILICGVTHRQTEFERRYFFWVHPLTIFGEIANVWLLAKHGNNWDASDLIPPIPNEWLFRRNTIRWTETVFQTGLSGGETFWIR